MLIDREWIEDAAKTKSFIKEFYRRKFKKDQWYNLILELNTFKQVSK